MKDLEVAIAQVFRKKGKASMSEKDFVFAVSLDFRWLTPKEAQKLLDLGMESELLGMKDGLVKPTFDYLGLEIPKGYAPGPDILQRGAQPKGMFMKMVDEISRIADLPAKDVISQVNSAQDRMGVDMEVAALVVAKNLGADLSGYLDTVEEEMGKRYKK
ncbi:MAG: DUF2240 family protein [Thermoplasmata archaeon]